MSVRLWLSGCARDFDRERENMLASGIDVGGGYRCSEVYVIAGNAGGCGLLEKEWAFGECLTEERAFEWSVYEIGGLECSGVVENIVQLRWMI